MSRKAGRVHPCSRNVSPCGGWADTVEHIRVTDAPYRELDGQK
jgi:hypothetical protein